MGLADSKLADTAPELVAVTVLIAAVFFGMWRIVSKVQAGQQLVVDQFLEHISTSEDRYRKATAAQMAVAEATAKRHEEVLGRMQQSLDRNTETLGRTGATLERASRVIERMEQRLEGRQAAEEKERQ